MAPPTTADNCFAIRLHTVFSGIRQSGSDVSGDAGRQAIQKAKTAGEKRNLLPAFTDGPINKEVTRLSAAAHHTQPVATAAERALLLQAHAVFRR
jgi:hypothetical protein